MSYKSYIDFRKVKITAGGEEYLQIPNANFIRCTEAPARFRLTIDNEQEMPFCKGWRWTLKDPQTFTELALKNPTSEEIEIEIYFGLGDLTDDTLNVIDPVASGLVIKSPPKVKHMAWDIPFSGGENKTDFDLFYWIPLPQNAVISHWLFTNNGPDQGDGSMYVTAGSVGGAEAVGGIIIPEGQTVEMRTSERLYVTANTRWSVACFFF